MTVQHTYSNGNSRPDAPKALGGVRVLDFAQVIAGPVCAGLLAEFGAEVIKIEQPGVGDSLRELAVQGTALWWAIESRNKRSITLNLRVPEGQDLAKRLIAMSDVMIENFLPGTMIKWNLGYDQVREVNPRIIMTSVSGFGQSGPYSPKPAYDRIAAAMGGWAAVTGDPDRAPGRPGLSIVDYATGVMAAMGTLNALYYRDAQGGTGQHVDASLLDTAVRMTEFTISAYDKFGILRSRTGNRHPGMAPGDHYETKDGQYVSMNAGSDRIFPRLLKVMGRPELVDDPRFSSTANRAAHYHEINDIVGEWVRTQDRATVVELLEAAGVPIGPINTAADIVQDPHIVEREMVIEVEDSAIGPVKMQGITPKLSATPGRVERPAPALGEANEEVYCGLLGLTKDDLERLTAKGVI